MCAEIVDSSFILFHSVRTLQQSQTNSVDTRARWGTWLSKVAIVECRSTAIFYIVLMYVPESELTYILR